MKIEIGDPENPKLILEALGREMASVREQIAERKRLIESLQAIAEENKLFEARINEAKKTMFLLIHEKVQVAMARNVEEYVGLLEREGEALIAKKEK